MKIDLSDKLVVIEFHYVNWKDEPHDYVIDVESIERDVYGPQGKTGPNKRPQWVMHGHVVRRDGEPREDNPRRTFLMDRMEDVKEITA